MRYVVKIGGHSLDDLTSDAPVLNGLCTEIKHLLDVGHEIVLVHGGGPQIDQLLALSGIGSEFAEGLRVTTAATISTIQMALSAVNSAITVRLNAIGVKAVGLRGFDGNQVVGTAIGEPWGQVATRVEVDPTLILALWDNGIIPIMSPVVSDGQGDLLNCNADAFAGALCQALDASALFLLSDIDQVRANADDPASGLPKVSFAELEAMVADGRVSGGMVPKARAAIAAGMHGARRVIIANAATPEVLTRALTYEVPTTEVIS